MTFCAPLFPFQNPSSTRDLFRFVFVTNLSYTCFDCHLLPTTDNARSSFPPYTGLYDLSRSPSSFRFSLLSSLIGCALWSTSLFQHLCILRLPIIDDALSDSRFQISPVLFAYQRLRVAIFYTSSSSSPSSTACARRAALLGAELADFHRMSARLPLHSSPKWYCCETRHHRLHPFVSLISEP